MSTDQKAFNGALPSHDTRHGNVKLAGRVALVSGSCSGIGAAIAQELAAHGAQVVVNFPHESLQATAEAVVASLPTSSIALEADLATLDGPKSLVEQAVKVFGHIDILVNNAAVAVNLPFEHQTHEHWDRLVNLNGRGAFFLTQAVLPHLSKSGDARIINIISNSARDPPKGQAIYAGTKGMLDSFTKCWAKELPPHHYCTVNAVSPGPTDTAGFAEAGDEAMKHLQQFINATPCGGRLAAPSEIAHAVAFLCEERSRWINGTHMFVNGGLFID